MEGFLPQHAETAMVSGLDQEILYEITQRNGEVTASQLAQEGFGEESSQYGRQRSVNAAITRLRKAGLIEDVGGRCSHCGQATTRGVRNVPLRIKGKTTG